MAVVIVALGFMRGLLWWIGKRQSLPAQAMPVAKHRRDFNC
jgi:hypothetical protein